MALTQTTTVSWVIDNRYPRRWTQPTFFVNSNYLILYSFFIFGNSSRRLSIEMFVNIRRIRRSWCTRPVFVRFIYVNLSVVWPWDLYMTLTLFCRRSARFWGWANRVCTRASPVPTGCTVSASYTSNSAQGRTNWPRWLSPKQVR